MASRDHQPAHNKGYEPPTLAIPEVPNAEPLSAADLDAPPPEPVESTPTPTAEVAPDADAITFDDIEAWEKIVIVDERSFPGFYDVPKRHEPPFNRFYFAWINMNPLNLQLKEGLGWRLVPPALGRKLGLTAHAIKADGVRVMDMMLAYIPRKPIDEARRRAQEAEITDPTKLASVQQLLDMNNPKHGITTFAGPAEEVAEFQRWRTNRPIQVGYTGRRG